MTLEEGSVKGETGRSLPWPVLVGVALVALLVGAVWYFTSGRPAPPPEAVRLPFGPEEQASADRVRFKNIKMSRAANFLDQEVTFITGTVENAGTRGIREMEVEIEFRDMLNQIVLREPHRLYGKDVKPLPGGMSREFQFTFEHIPVDWNRQYPGIRITGLSLEQ